jgi:hypothetical protein
LIKHRRREYASQGEEVAKNIDDDDDVDNSIDEREQSITNKMAGPSGSSRYPGLAGSLFDRQLTGGPGEKGRRERCFLLFSFHVLTNSLSLTLMP